mmetsp:Transcript_33177/g.72355  ORF Transcript_33177/g.72355 Transcript_33177/m.72355 type:complete len:101 (-) Transcript_33177:321-623(-)
MSDNDIGTLRSTAQKEAFGDIVLMMAIPASAYGVGGPVHHDTGTSAREMNFSALEGKKSGSIQELDHQLLAKPLQSNIMIASNDHASSTWCPTKPVAEVA